jgi:uncharacterized protein (DUF2147 family)
MRFTISGSARLAAGVALAVAMLAPGAARAQTTPVGRWKTIDDDGRTEKSIVRIVEKDGRLSGTIEKLFRKPGEDPEPKCDKCEGERKDQPVIGLNILWDLKADGDEWTGGRILDPENGKTYRCKMEVQEDGRRLKVRGFVGLSLFGRNQYWIRVD